MEKLFVYALAMAMCLGTSAVLANSGMGARKNQTPYAQAAADGAFRDGLFLGKLSAQSGRPLHPPTGRWATDKDRASFVAGYRLGYQDSVSVAESQSAQ
jgi:hypothetical protein